MIILDSWPSEHQPLNALKQFSEQGPYLVDDARNAEKGSTGKDSKYLRKTKQNETEHNLTHIVSLYKNWRTDGKHLSHELFEGLE